MLRLDLLVLLFAGQALGLQNGLLRFLGKFIEIHGIGPSV